MLSKISQTGKDKSYMSFSYAESSALKEWQEYKTSFVWGQVIVW
jgi:hypothetical protein